MTAAEGISSTCLIYLIRNLNSVHCEFVCSFFIVILTAVFKQEETRNWTDEVDRCEGCEMQRGLAEEEMPPSFQNSLQSIDFKMQLLISVTFIYLFYCLLFIELLFHSKSFLDELQSVQFVELGVRILRNSFIFGV